MTTTRDAAVLPTISVPLFCVRCTVEVYYTRQGDNRNGTLPLRTPRMWVALRFRGTLAARSLRRADEQHDAADSARRSGHQRETVTRHSAHNRRDC